MNELLSKKFATVICIFLMIWFYTGVQAIGNNWLAGSAIAEPMLKNFKLAEGTSYILNLPDNYNGTYMLRTGFADGVSLMKGLDCTKKIKILSYHPIQLVNDSITITALGENTFEVRLLATKNRFYFMEKLFKENQNSNLFSILEYSDRAFVVQFNKFEEGDALYYYSMGKLKEINI